MPVPRRECIACKRQFVPDRFNVHHQKYCTHPACVREHKRKRQREWAARQREDPAFRRLQCKRVVASRRLHQAARPDSPAPPSTSGMEHALIGLAARLTEASCAAEVKDYLRDCEEQGRRLTQDFGPPLFLDVNRHSLFARPAC